MAGIPVVLRNGPFDGREIEVEVLGRAIVVPYKGGDLPYWRTYEEEGGRHVFDCEARERAHH